MDETQRQHEQAVGDAFIQVYNRLKRCRYTFAGRAGEAPDLVYRDDGPEIRLEIVDCYYDTDDAKVKWQNARDVYDAPTEWSGVNPDDALLDSINAALRGKCAKDYGPNCLLIVNVSPGVTTAEEMGALLENVAIPGDPRFAGIYLTGMFGFSSDGSMGGYRVWELWPGEG